MLKSPLLFTLHQSWQASLIFLICLGLFGIWWRLGQPEDFVFDEQYHVPAARAVLQGDWRIFDWWQPPLADAEIGTYADWLHPPIFKYLQAGSIQLWGDRPWAWRFPSAVAATGVVGLVFILGQQLSGKKAHRMQVGLLAASLMALSGLGLVQARTGMNDMVLTLFGLGAVVAYGQARRTEQNSPARKWLLVTGILAGLALATKWTGGLLLLGLLGLEFWRQRSLWRQWPWVVISLGVVPGLIYLAMFWPIWTTGRGWEHFIKLHQAIWQYQTTRDQAQSDHSPAWQWPLNLQPVRYWRGELSVNQPAVGTTMSTISASENPGLNVVLLAGVSWWVWRIFQAWLHKRSLSSHTWLLALYLVWWLPLLASPRILFQYHYLPAVPVAAGLTATAVQVVWPRLTLVGKVTLGIAFGLAGVIWIGLYPHWTGLPVPLWLAQTVY